MKNTWNVERDDRRKKTRENEKPRVFFKKGLWKGKGKRSKTSLELPGFPFFCLTDNNTPLKNPRIAGKTVLVVIISKQNNRHKHKKGKSTKKNKQHNNNQDSNNRKTRRPKMQETWVWKGDAMELALNESNKIQER